VCIAAVQQDECDAYDSVRGGRTRYAGGGVGELGKSSDDMNSSIGVARRMGVGDSTNRVNRP